MKKSHYLRTTALAAIVGAGLMQPVGSLAQVSSSVHGRVQLEHMPAQEGVPVTARNVDSGITYRGVTRADGSYSLNAINPGLYEIHVTVPGYPELVQRVVVQVAQSTELDLVLTNQKQEEIIVSGTRTQDFKTSSVGATLTPEELEVVPQITRNFLVAADAAPGVVFRIDSKGNTSLQGGGSSIDNVTVIIDGVNQKSYITGGGIGGQVSGQVGGASAGTKGNPFPELAIKEYKVLSQNYPAEIDQVASAAIIAVTKSGTNEFHGDAFVDFTNNSLSAKNYYAPGAQPKTHQYQYGADFGGPIIEDKAHFYIAYEGKRNEDPQIVYYNNANYIPLLPASARGLAGSIALPFQQDMVFGKLDFEPNGNNLIELSSYARIEDQVAGPGGQDSAGYSYDTTNNVFRTDLKWTYTSDSFVNEAGIHTEYLEYAPTPTCNGLGYQYLYNGQTQIVTGCNSEYQDTVQKGILLQDDLTLPNIQAFGEHTFKTGFKTKFESFFVRDESENNPQIYYDLRDPAGLPYQVQFGVGSGVTRTKDTQIGLYAQDDWKVTEALTANVGLRWDYETNAFNNGFVTPSAVVSALKGYAPINLPNSGINISDYISTGSNRKPITDEFQPRLGLSYDLTEDQTSVVYGGWGRAYDRVPFSTVINESRHLNYHQTDILINTPNNPCSGAGKGAGACLQTWNPAYATPAGFQQLVQSVTGGYEIDLLPVNPKAPRADQGSIGFRQKFGDWETDFTYSNIHTYDGMRGLLGNRWPNGTFSNGQPVGNQAWGNPVPGYGNLVLFSNGQNTLTNSLAVQANKPYNRESGWGFRTTVTYSTGSANGGPNQATDDGYSFDYENFAAYGHHTNDGLERWRIVSSGEIDGPWGTLLAAKMELSTGYATGEFENGWVFENLVPKKSFIVGKFWGYRDIDLNLQKTVDYGGGISSTFRVDLINAFNFHNGSPYALQQQADGSFYPQDILGLPRTIKVGFSSKF